MNIRAAIHDYLNTLSKDVMNRAYQKAKIMILDYIALYTHFLD